MDRQERLEDHLDDATRDMEENARELQERGEELDAQVEETRSDWERKRHDPRVPGADPPDEPDEAGEEVAGDWEGEGPAAEEAGQ